MIFFPVPLFSRVYYLGTKVLCEWSQIVRLKWLVAAEMPNKRNCEEEKVEKEEEEEEDKSICSWNELEIISIVKMLFIWIDSDEISIGLSATEQSKQRSSSGRSENKQRNSIKYELNIGLLPFADAKSAYIRMILVKEHRTIPNSYWNLPMGKTINLITKC